MIPTTPFPIHFSLHIATIQKKSKDSCLWPDDVVSWRLFSRRTFRSDLGIRPLLSSAVFIPTDINFRNSSPTDHTALNDEPNRRGYRASKEEAKDIILPKMSL
jgi:hypothetical protein